MTTSYGNLPDPPEELREVHPELLTYLDQLVRQIELALTRMEQPYSLNWALSNVPTSGNKTLDANAATADEVRKALVVLLRDLDDVGKITRT